MLLVQGAKQYGAKTSKLLSIAHVLFYVCALFEATYFDHRWDDISFVGALLMLFAYGMLFWVINELRGIWTVKLYILPEHKINTSFLFRTIKHPNYFLNILLELGGVALLCHAWHTLMLLLPVYLVILAVRIYQEEKVMKPLFK